MAPNVGQSFKKKNASESVKKKLSSENSKSAKYRGSARLRFARTVVFCGARCGALASSEKRAAVGAECSWNSSVSSVFLNRALCDAELERGFSINDIVI